MTERDGKKYLVFSSQGDSPAVRFNNLDAVNFDVCVAHYGESEYENASALTYFLKNKAYKIPNFLKCVETFEALLFYDYYLFVDDDLEISAETMAKTFEIAEQYRLKVCQPSITQDSQYSWGHLRHQEGVFLEYVNFVEIQCFCVSRDFLMQALPYFYFVQSGYYLDLIFSYLLRNDPTAIAVIHGLQYRHPYRAEELTVRGDSLEFSKNRQAVERLAHFVLPGMGHLDDFRPESYGILSEPSLPLPKQAEIQVAYKTQRFRWISQTVRNLLRVLLKDKRQDLHRFRENRLPLDAFSVAESRLLFSYLTEETKVLEYGATLITRDIARQTKQVTSVTHEAQVYAALKEPLTENTVLLYHPPLESSSTGVTEQDSLRGLGLADFISRDGSFEAFSAYVEAPGTTQQYDVILLRGRARLHCLDFIYRNKLLKPGGKLFIHHYYEEWLGLAQLWFRLERVADRLAMFTLPKVS